ncbi:MULTISPECIES: glycosyltransferase family 9 protein [Burkholderia]|jgi:ADP-heptose:LPS heptosyltransferase|uniref:glycosyltransferase family 9 protein n=1 Tax=Burkholderia TaxID=32008 RepID=UPI00080B1A6E|nr:MULTISPECIES: glycosyltransferase family 9 protein [Burkholderia]MBU9181291.1 glycosyltransferase family 9 protein [Burkholderia multivorans]MBU9251905.1 glycosyltransferase family 9 protein [Burkholderia multivorans]MBU9257421.1 glycosyltransferase family 9 protein [Burkholderia multivorans]MBU9301041.1 glycosyltransferase family 9 protein [Burkholderia multivorans]MBU9313392.1 glycosyltransferase family 9 protein [Burkholderia multivorans]
MRSVDGHIGDVRSIAVVGPDALGDTMMTLPALRALRVAYRDACIVYVGLDWHASFFRDRPGPIDVVRVRPAAVDPGRPLPPDAPPVDRMFRVRADDPPFDVAVQLYGGGAQANPFTRALGARIAVGACAPGAPPLDRWTPYGRWQNRRLLALEIVSLAGATLWPAGPDLAVIERDRHAMRAALPPDIAKHLHELVVVQPSARDPRRRWSPRHFAAVADRLAARGLRIAVVGTTQERPLVRAVLDAMHAPALDLAGALDIGGLAALLEHAALMLSNDTGPLHLAAALGTPCVGIFWFTNALQALPLAQGRCRAAVSARIVCPVCGEPNLTSRCAHDDSFVDDVTVDEVATLADEVLAERT